MSDEDDELDLPITWPMSMDDMERFIKINMAERAIVEAADAQEAAAREWKAEIDRNKSERAESSAPFVRWEKCCRKTHDAVDAWRKLREER